MNDGFLPAAPIIHGKLPQYNPRTVEFTGFHPSQLYVSLTAYHISSVCAMPAQLSA